MQGLAFRGHEEARENLSASCRVIRDNYLELLSLRAKDLPQWCNGQWNYYPFIVRQKLLRVLNLKKTSIIHILTVSSLDETSDISKLEQFHISDIYLDCKGAKVLHITYYSMDADQMCSESGLHMFNQFKLHIKMNLKALFVSWSYLKRRFNVSSKVSFKIDWIWGQMLRQSTWFTWAA